MKKKQDYNSDFLDFLNQRYGTVDSDHDGITDEVEEILGTDPNNFDTDGDGVGDGDEIRLGRNPLGEGKLKDFFVPHNGNNYLPHALHPHRLFFYSFSAILTKILVIIFVLGFPALAWLSPDLLTAQSDKIITLTNNLRHNFGIHELTKNSLLTQAAYNKAEDMLVQQYFAHLGPDKKSLKDWLKKVKYNYAVAGENLAIGFADADSVMQAWIKSKTHYANLIDPDFTEIGVGLVAGQYQGQETTLVAQYFGRKSYLVPVKENYSQVEQIISPVALPKKLQTREEKVVPQVLAEKKQENVLLDELKRNVVVQEKIIPELRLLAPADNTITNIAETKLQILALGATEVKVFNQKELVWQTEKKAKEKIAIANIKLHRGQNIIKLVSFVDDDKVSSKDYLLTLDQEPPQIDYSQTKLEMDVPQNRDVYIVQFKTKLSPDTKSAQLNVAGYMVNLHLVGRYWAGSAVIDKKDSLQTITLANLAVQDRAGNKKIYDLDWDKIKLSKASLIDQYFFLKSNADRKIQVLFEISALFFKILLALAIIALGLNIFIEIKKQHPQIIFSTIAFIILLLILIIY